MRRETTEEIVDRLIAERSVLTTQEVADAAQVSRQMAQKVLKARVDEGRLTIEGRARAARYRRTRVDDSAQRVGDLVPAPVLPRRNMLPASWIAEALQVDDQAPAPVDEIRTSTARPVVDDVAAAAESPTVIDAAQVVDFRRAPQLWDSGSPYVSFTDAPAPRRVLLEVASAGSLYRLSARMLLDGVDAEEVVLDFTGVMDVGDEFLEEVFQVWARAHPSTRVQAINVPASYEEALMRALC